MQFIVAQYFFACSDPLRVMGHLIDINNQFVNCPNSRNQA